MPRNKPSQSSPVRPARKTKANPVMPFSLILSQEEMAVLRMEARQQGISVGSVVRGALHAVLFRTKPDFVREMVKQEVESFLDDVQMRHPGTKITPPLRARIRRRIIALLQRS